MTCHVEACDIGGHFLMIMIIKQVKGFTAKEHYMELNSKVHSRPTG